MFLPRPSGKLLRAGLFLIAWAGASVLRADDLSEYYGFGAMEILKLEWELGTPVAEDLNGDSLNDLIVCNNRKARIELLLQKRHFDPEAAETAPQPEEENVNDLFGREATWRFERFQYPLHVKATSLAVGDFNHDRQLDLAYYSAEGLYVVLQDRDEGTRGTGLEPVSHRQDADATTLTEPSWEAPTRFDLRDGLRTSEALTAGDLNGDGRTDLVLLLQDGCYVLLQGADGRLARPVRHYSSCGNLRQVEIGDVNGDGRCDLVLLTADQQEHPVRVRLQNPDGSLGPEGRYAMPMPHVLRLYELGNSDKQVIASVLRPSGRLAIHAMVREDQQRSAVVIHPLPSGDNADNRDMVSADVDGDGLTDMVVTDPGRGQFLVFRGQKRGGLGPADTYPGLKDMRKVCVARLGDGPGDTLVVLSVDEKLIALSRFEQGPRGEGVPPLRREAILASPSREERGQEARDMGRLRFPQTVAVVGQPQAMELADLDQDGRLDLAYVAKGPEPEGAFFLRSVLGIGQAGSQAGPSLPLTSVEDRPKDLLACDIDHDGDTDLIVVRSYDPLLLLRQTQAGVFEQQAQDQTHSGLVSNMTSCTISVAPLGKDGSPALLVARGEFARSIYFHPDKGWQVIDQYQTGDGRRQIRVAAAMCRGPRAEPDAQRPFGPGPPLRPAGILPARRGQGQDALATEEQGQDALATEEQGQDALATGETPSIVAYDDVSGIVFFMDPQADGTYRVSREVNVGTAKVRKILAGHFDAGSGEDLVLCADRELICIRADAQWTLRQIAGFEPSIEGGALGPFAIGDVNSDGGPDLVLCEQSRYHLQILSFDENARLIDACKFKIFEAHPRSAVDRQQGRSPNSGEPRHVLIRDVTGDGRNDLVLLVHDRIILYPQDGTD